MITANYSIFGQNSKPNTFIGGFAKTGGSGVNAPVNTIALLANKLSINASRISVFRVVGNDLECRILGAYNIPDNSIGSNQPANANQNITYYHDDEMLVKYIGQNGFVNCANFTSLKTNGVISRNQGAGLVNRGILDSTNCNHAELNSLVVMDGYYWFRNTKIVNLQLPNLVSMLNFSGSVGQNFQNMTMLELLSAKKLRQIGTDPSLNSGNFFGIKTGAKIQVHIDLRTVNSGNAHADLVWVKANRAAIVEFYDDNGSYVSSL